MDVREKRVHPRVFTLQETNIATTEFSSESKIPGPRLLNKTITAIRFGNPVATTLHIHDPPRRDPRSAHHRARQTRTVVHVESHGRRSRRHRVHVIHGEVESEDVAGAAQRGSQERGFCDFVGLATFCLLL